MPWRQRSFIATGVPWTLKCEMRQAMFGDFMYVVVSHRSQVQWYSACHVRWNREPKRKCVGFPIFGGTSEMHNKLVLWRCLLHIHSKFSGSGLRVGERGGSQQKFLIAILRTRICKRPLIVIRVPEKLYSEQAIHGSTIPKV